MQVKCDQGLPGCKQCMQQELDCPGYQKALKWVDISQEPKAIVSSRRKKDSSFKIFQLSGGDRISPPRKLRGSSSVPPQIVDESFLLIHHYFSRVCQIAGCFDSALSSFRIIPATTMAYSKPVHLLLQASSAAQLTRQHPEMRYKALTLQSEAFSAIRNEINNIQHLIVPDELMLSCIFAGLTSSWYDVNDLGVSHVLGSQFLLSFWLTSKKARLKYHQTFILGAFVYWLAISAFVTGDPRSSFQFQEALQESLLDLETSHDINDDSDVPNLQRRIFPHPLTGFSMRTFICVGKVGSLCRLAHKVMGRGSSSGRFNMEDLLTKAKIIELELLGLFQNRESSFQDTQDSNTTIDEILAVGEAYRCAGLLQLYMTFPQILQLKKGKLDHWEDSSEKGSSSDPETSKVSNSIGLMAIQHNWLRRLAFHILSILETIPSTSGSRVIQGLPVLIAATWFVDPRSGDSPSVSLQHPHLSLTNTSKSKQEARDIVRKGLQMHERNVGLQQVSRVLEILEEVWRSDDTGEEKCDWIVLVASKGLQTLYG